MSADAPRFEPSRIVAVTVFSDLAHVTRRARIDGAAGPQRIVLEGLPSGLDAGAMRASTTLGLVRSIETEIVAKKTDDTSETAALESAIETLEGRSRQLMGQITALEAEIALIDQVVPAVGPAAQPGTIPPLRPEVFVEGLEVLSARRREAVASLRAVQAELRANEEELKTARDRRGRVGETDESGDKHAVLVVSLETPAAGECVLDLTYEAVWATWRPYYHIRLQPKEGTIECVRFADVWQETREDWTEVKLRLSTAEPESSLRVPSILPWTLGVAKGFEDKLGDLYARRRAQAEAPPPAKPRPMAPQGPPMTRSAPSRGAPPPPPPLVTPASYTAEELRAPNEPPVITQIESLPQAADDFDDYRQQFEDEGVFANRTASGMAMMRAPAPKDRGGGGFGSPEVEVFAYAAAQRDATVEPGPRTSRTPGQDHPDFVRLSQSAAPKAASGGIDHEFEVGGATTCKSGKERHRLSFGSVPYPAKIEYLLRPGVKDHAFGRVTVVNNENVPMLAGPAAIFVGDAFFGETVIRTTPAGGKLILDLGAETAIKSARRSKTTVRTEGILTKEDVHVVEVGIDIENHLGTVAEIEVKDQVPVSLDPKVKVRLMKTTPKDADLDELTGILTFRIRVAPGARSEVLIAYEIEAPKNYQFVQMLKE